MLRMRFADLVDRTVPIQQAGIGVVSPAGRARWERRAMAPPRRTERSAPIPNHDVRRRFQIDAWREKKFRSTVDPCEWMASARSG